MTLHATLREAVLAHEFSTREMAVLAGLITALEAARDEFVGLSPQEWHGLTALRSDHVRTALEGLAACAVVFRRDEAAGTLWSVNAAVDGWKVRPRSLGAVAVCRLLRGRNEANQLTLALDEDPNLAREVSHVMHKQGSPQIGEQGVRGVPQIGERAESLAKTQFPNLGSPLKSKGVKEISFKSRAERAEGQRGGADWEWLRDEVRDLIGMDWQRDGGKWVNRIFGNRAKGISPRPWLVEKAWAEVKRKRAAGVKATRSWAAMLQVEWDRAEQEAQARKEAKC